MNIAFPALLIFLLLLPGILYRYSYARGPWGWENPTSIRTVSDEIAYSAIVAVGFHVSWMLAASTLGFRVDLASLFAFLSGNFGKDSVLLQPSVRAITEHRAAVLSYFLSLYASVAALGYGAHALVRWRQFDLRWSMLRFENDWYYRLRGEVLGFGENEPSLHLPDGVYASAVVEQGTETYLYWGILEDWALDGEGDLDRLYLTVAHRRRLRDDRASETQDDADLGHGPDERFYEIRGDALVLRYADVRTLNLDYFWVDVTEEDAPTAATATPEAL